MISSLLALTAVFHRLGQRVRSQPLISCSVLAVLILEKISCKCLKLDIYSVRGVLWSLETLSHSRTFTKRQSALLVW